MPNYVGLSYRRVATSLFSDPPPLAGNILAQPYDLNNGSWNNKGLASVTVNATVAPDGSSNADLMIPNGTSSSDHKIANTLLTVSAGNWLMRGRYKPSGY